MSRQPTLTPRQLTATGEVLLSSRDEGTLDPLRCGVISSSMASALFGRAVVDAEVAARRWTRPAHDVVVLHNGPLDPHQRLWVALLASPPGSVLGGLTALELEGFRTTQLSNVTTIGPHRSRRPGWSECAFWVSRQLGPEDINSLRSPPRTRPSRAAIDVASRAPTDVVCRGTILAVVQQGVTTPRQLRDVVRRFPTLPRRRLIRESILDADGGIQSVPELEFDQIRIARHLPAPSRQVVVRRDDGRYYLDAEWEKFQARCEIHGAPHFSVAGWSDDMERQNNIVLTRGSLLVFTSYSIRHRKHVVGDQVAALLRRGGWSG